MRSATIFLAIILSAGAAQANIPLFNATCGTNIDVHADKGGPVYINGKQATLTKYDNKNYDAVHGNHTVSFGINPDGSLIVTYTNKNGTNGICAVRDHKAAVDVCPADVSEADRYKYPACN